MYYLGKYGSEASRREYDRIIGEFIANGRQAFYDPDDILIESLVVSFLDYVEKECNYCPSSLLRINRPLQLLNDLYGKTAVSQFTPSALNEGLPGIRSMPTSARSSVCSHGVSRKKLSLPMLRER